MTIERYYRWLQTETGRKIKDLINRWFPGLLPEPVPVRVPVRRPENQR